MIKCDYCQQSNKPDNEACRFCGAPLDHLIDRYMPRFVGRGEFSDIDWTRPGGVLTFSDPSCSLLCVVNGEEEFISTTPPN